MLGGNRGDEANVREYAGSSRIDEPDPFGGSARAANSLRLVAGESRGMRDRAAVSSVPLRSHADALLLPVSLA